MNNKKSSNISISSDTIFTALILKLVKTLAIHWEGPDTAKSEFTAGSNIITR